ncbi:hypothetical protein MANES_S042216v8 [Manihot esculenta]|uniref:Uncharacterized protein n=1 Tax=Manihot esculenta TaxID=3983 RepID=A0ACB7FWL9_MANES|nr:hypothetical protein MANES_S042216v8 [Manihot esculenta]
MRCNGHGVSSWWHRLLRRLGLATGLKLLGSKALPGVSNGSRFKVWIPHSEHRRTCDATCLSLCPWWCRPAAWWGLTFLGVVDGRRGCCGFAIPRLGG